MKFNQLEIIDIFTINILSKNNILRREKRCTCRCECGGYITTNYYAVASKKVMSCGCYLKVSRGISGRELASKTTKEERQLKYVFSQYKSHAKYNNRDFTLTREEFSNIVFSNCHYCGSEPSNLVKKERYGGPFYYNGIDRKDTSGHYTLENSLPCCISCNKAKSDMTYNEFKEWSVKLYNKFGKYK